MKLTWFGHAAFAVETAGIRLILDPYRSPDCGGFAPIDEPADLVVVSHINDRYHSHLGQIRPPFQVVRGLELPPGGLTLHGVHLSAIPCYENPQKLPGDEVTILVVESQGRKLVHLGDLGHALTEDEAAPLRHADLLLVPAGGPPTIDFPLIEPLIAQLAPRLIVPMHYLVPGKIDLPIQPVESFLATLPSWPVERVPYATIDLAGSIAGPIPRIVCLRPAR
jgi:L-ascorbate metabolism protein UlaG (beta-lactamase superfamily)